MAEGAAAAENPPAPLLSIVVPALDEAQNALPLVEEIERTVLGAGVDAELIVVDDGSTDGTSQRLLEAARSRPWLRVLRRARPQGQSAAMYAGIQAARAPFVATLDADLQNDPADLPAMLDILREQGVDLVQGDRSRNRRDGFLRRRASEVGRMARRLLLKDSVRDTGCSARVMRAELARRLPLQYKGMHRFVPAYFALMGGRVAEYGVTHRPRVAGETKYGVGVVTRGLGGLVDCFAVRWMSRRLRDVAAEPQVEAGVSRGAGVAPGTGRNTASSEAASARGRGQGSRATPDVAELTPR